MRFRHLFRSGLATLLASLPAASSVSGCEDSTNAAPVAFEGGLIDVGTGAGDGPVPDGGGPGDANPDDASSFPTEPGISLANMWGTPLDFCFRPPAATDFTGPVFEAQGGVPDRAVSVRHPVPPESFVILVNAGAGCASTPIYTGSAVTTDRTPAITLVVRGGTISDARQVFFRPDQHVAGKDNVYYGRQGRDATFQPSSGAAIPIDDATPTPLDPGVMGELELAIPANTVTRSVKTAVGVVLLLDAPHPETTPLLCDLLAPPVGHLHVCDATVRAP